MTSLGRIIIIVIIVIIIIIVKNRPLEQKSCFINNKTNNPQEQNKTV